MDGIMLCDLVPEPLVETFKQFSRFRNLEVDEDVPKTPVVDIPPILQTMAMVGFYPYGKCVTPKFYPHNRAFDRLAAYTMMYEGRPVRTIHFPPLGANTLIDITDMRSANSAATLRERAVGGIRQKRDGYEVVQFVIELVDGEEFVVRYDTDKISVLSSGSPALLERVGDKYYLLEGFPPKDLDISEDEWLPPTKKSVLKIMDETSDGIIVECQGVSYKCKDQSDVTISVENGVARLAADIVPIQPVQKDGLYDIDLNDSKPYPILRERPDKLVGDSHLTVAKVRNKVRPGQLYASLASKGESAHSIPVCRYGQGAFHVGFTKKQEYRDHEQLISRCLREYGTFTNYELSQRIAYDGKFRIGSRILDYQDNRITTVVEEGIMLYRDTPPPRFSPFRVWEYSCADSEYIGGKAFDYHGRRRYLVYESIKMSDDIYLKLYGRLPGRNYPKVMHEGDVVRDNIWAMVPKGAETTSGVSVQDLELEWLSSYRGDGIYGWFYKERRFRD